MKSEILLFLFSRMKKKLEVTTKVKNVIHTSDQKDLETRLFLSRAS
jgi:hypothetical protein